MPLPPADISPLSAGPTRLAQSPDCAISVKPAGCEAVVTNPTGPTSARLGFPRLGTAERESACLLDEVAARPRLAAAALLALALVRLSAGPIRAAAGRPHRDRLCPDLARHARARRLLDRLHYEASAFLSAPSASTGCRRRRAQAARTRGPGARSRPTGCRRCSPASSPCSRSGG